ncbi:MAG: hypothetical protein CM15mV141_090 [uncultured marine virus]|nr:MAG: hypothetical protein CM15mV141_090 [uncultured marine virus]
MTIQIGDARADIKVLKIYQEIERDDKEFYVCLVQGKSNTHWTCTKAFYLNFKTSRINWSNAVMLSELMMRTTSIES